jgi:hypothetical protein
MKLKCGCEIIYGEYGGIQGIKFCPLHEAAEDLLEAHKQSLEFIEDEIYTLQTTKVAIPKALIEFANNIKQAIAKARGEK